MTDLTARRPFYCPQRILGQQLHLSASNHLVVLDYRALHRPMGGSGRTGRMAKITLRRRHFICNIKLPYRTAQQNKR